MKVVFYGVKLNGGESQREYWQWHFSLDINVDIQHWERHYKQGELCVLEPKISLGQAIWMKDELHMIYVKERQLALQHRRDPHMKHMKDVIALTPFSALQQVMRIKIAQLKLSNQLEHHFKLLKIPLKNIQLSHRSHAMNLDKTVLFALKKQLQGRALLQEEFMDLLDHMQLQHIDWRSYVQQLYLHGDIMLLNGVSYKKRPSIPLFKPKIDYVCHRCGGGNDQMYWTYCHSCENDCPYCEACLEMGRTRFCSLLIHGQDGRKAWLMKEAKSPYPGASASVERWRLSPAQQEAATSCLQFLADTLPPKAPWSGARGGSGFGGGSGAGGGREGEGGDDYDSDEGEAGGRLGPPCFIIWAVTGAGKTEMTFPLLASEFASHRTVAIATPRRDVVLELKPRLEKAFPERDIVTLYGGSEQRWEKGDLVLATTHQMIRFYKAFDLIIIDEVDAFPFRYNAMLEHAVHQSCNSQGRFIVLTATPPPHLQKAIKNKRLPHVKVCVRFHRHPLPVPRIITYKPRTLKHEIEQSLRRGAQVFVFVPRIKQIPPLVTQLRRAFPQHTIDGTSSQDSERYTKVQHFRTGLIRLLVTTTILERGVTVPKTDVVIVYADDDIFDESALVQMSGRSGRASSDPYGRVVFLAKNRTKAQVKAVKQIKAMNKLARQKGYLSLTKKGASHHVSV